jgi:hypothetical protein
MYIVQRMFRYLQLVILVVGSCLVQLGCSTTAIIEVESTRRAELVGVSDVGVVYALVPSSAIVLSDSVHYDAFALQVEFVLDGLGFVPVADTGQDVSELRIELSYGISGPKKKTYTYYAPEYGSGGAGCCTCPPMACSCSSTSYYSSSLGHSHSVVRSGYYYVFRRTLELTAIEVGRNSAEPAWKTSATSTGRSDDLGAVFPLLLSAIEPYVGTNGRGVVRKSLGDVKVMELTK